MGLSTARGAIIAMLASARDVGGVRVDDIRGLRIVRRHNSAYDTYVYTKKQRSCVP